MLTRRVLCLPQNAVKKNDLATGKTVLGQIKVSSSTGSIAGTAHIRSTAALSVNPRLCLPQVKLIQLPAVPPNCDFSSPTAQQELLLARKHFGAAGSC
jgi:hypothetical protein